MEKMCFKCGKTKSVDGFYVHPEMSDGHLGKCKECARRDVIEHRNLNIERIRAYDRERGKLPRRVKANTARNKVRRRENPQQYKAQGAVSNAVRDGRLEKPEKCQSCGARTRLCGHHADYSQPLQVAWLCYVCHKSEHKPERMAV